jgi:P-type Cu+ transporter
MVKDPVCGMDVKPEKAAGKSEFGGRTYYFCCAACKQKFDLNPQAFAGAKPSKVPQPT